MIGSVSSVWRYPVKSMQGTQVQSARVAAGGIVGDRRYALVDVAEGRLVSAKNPRRWSGILDVATSFSVEPGSGDGAGTVLFRLSDGQEIRSDQPDVNRRLSEYLKREVTLRTDVPPAPALEQYHPDRDEVTIEAIPAGAFFDAAPLHLLTTATLRRLRELYPEGNFDVRRFRPNLLIETAAEATGFVENEWIGKTLAIGPSVRVRIVGPCPRCVMTTLPQQTLPADPVILRTAAKHNQANIGVYAEVIDGGGEVKTGAAVKVADGAG